MRSPHGKQMLQVAMVDDEEPLCLAVRRILDKYQVHVADVGVDVAYASTHFASGEQFFERSASGAEFDLLLLDLKLPGMSGLDILAELGEQGRGILTIMITAYATFETAVQATKLGAYDFLPKPFSPEELRYAVRKATDQLIISREARRLAEEKRQVRFNFISVLSHELKAPLNAIEGYLKILQTDEPPERLPMIDRSLIRLDGMRKLIFDLLDLTRIESGQKQRSSRQVDVRAVAKAAIDLFTPEAAGARHRHHAAGARAGGDGGRPERDGDHPQQPGLQRGQVQPRRRQRHGRPGARRTTVGQDPGGRHRHRHDPRGERQAVHTSSSASRTRTRTRSWAAGWDCRRCASWPSSTAATRRSRARRARAAPSPSRLHATPMPGGAVPGRPTRPDGRRRRRRDPAPRAPCAAIIHSSSARYDSTSGSSPRRRTGAFPSGLV